jgi:hypothetical protein
MTTPKRLEFRFRHVCAWGGRARTGRQQNPGEKNATIHLAYSFVRCVPWGLWSDRCAGRLRSEITGAPSEFIFQILFFALQIVTYTIKRGWQNDQNGTIKIEKSNQL